MTHPHFSRTQLRRAVLSSYLGSVIEYYDFLLYATASALVFNKVFFSNLDPLVGTVASFGTLATGYLARPLGGIVFGHFGDRIGRKKMLVLSMTLMGVGSTLIGLLPTYAQIGVWAPILLVLLRVVQGIAVGGEWGGAVLMSAEHATSRRGPVGQLHQRRRAQRRRALDPRAGRFRSADRRAAVPGLGLAHPVPAQHRAARPSACSSGPGSPRRPSSPRPPPPKPAAAAAGRGAAPPPAQPPAVDRRRLRRLRRAGHHHHLRHLLRGAGRLPAADRAQRAHPVLGRGGLRHHRLLRAVRPRGTHARSCSPARSRWPSTPSLLFPLIDSGSVAAARPRARRSARASCTPPGTGPSPRSTPSCSPPAPATPAPRWATRSPASARGIAPLVFASVLAGGGGTTTVSIIIAAGCLLCIGCLLALRETSTTDLTVDPETAAAPAGR